MIRSIVFCAVAASLALAAQLREQSAPNGTVLFVTTAEPGPTLALKGRDLQSGKQTTIHQFQPKTEGVFWHQASAVINQSVWVTSVQPANTDDPSPLNGSIVVTDLTASPPVSVVSHGAPVCWWIAPAGQDAVYCFQANTSSQTTTLWHLPASSPSTEATRVGSFPPGLVSLNEIGWCGWIDDASPQVNTAGLTAHPQHPEACCGLFSDHKYHCLNTATGKPLDPAASLQPNMTINAVARDPKGASAGLTGALAIVSVQNTSSPDAYFCDEFGRLDLQSASFSSLQPPLPTEQCWRNGPYAEWGQITPQATAAPPQNGQGPWLLVVAWTRSQPPQRYIVASEAQSGSTVFQQPVPLADDEELASLAWSELRLVPSASIQI